LEDSKIIELFFERSEQAIGSINSKYGTVIRKVSSNILKNVQDVEECVNDTYLQIWNIIPPQKPQKLGAFVCRIARNISLNRYYFNSADKRNNHYDIVLDELTGIIPDSTTVEAEYEAKELAAYINSFLGTLTLKDRCLFMQRYWFGCRISQIAESMDMTSHAVSVRLFRIRKKLEKYLKKEGIFA